MNTNVRQIGFDACYVVETLTRAGAWGEALSVAEAGVNGSEPTIRNRSRRIHCRFVALAAEFEKAIADGRVEKLPALTRQWRENVQEQQEHEADVKKRKSKTGFPGAL